MRTRGMLQTLPFALGLGLCGVTIAAPIVVDTWDASEGWARRWYFGANHTTIQDPGTVGGQSALRIVGGTNAPSEYQIYTQDGAFTGDYTTGSGVGGGTQVVRSVRFDFYAENPPANLELYFVGGGYTWFYQLNPGTGWTHFMINLLADDDPGGWYAIGRTAADFFTDLTSVSEIGILLAYQSIGPGQVYGIDNFELNDEYYVPEPGTYYVLATAFLSVGLVFRRRMSGLLSRPRT